MLEDKSSVSSEETPQLSATGTRQNGIAFCESEDENVAGKSEKAIKLPQSKV